MTHSTTIFSRLPSSIWFNRILPQLDHQSRPVFACTCQEAHELINNYCGAFVGFKNGSHSKPFREIRNVQLRTEDQKIIAYQASISLDHAIAVAVMKGDLQPDYIINGIMAMVSYTSLRSMEFINTALLTTDIAITLVDNLPAVKTFVFDGCIGIVPSLLLEYMRNNPELVCRKTIKYAPSFNTSGLGTFRSWAGKAHMFWAALLAIYMPVIMDVAPQLMEENSIFFQAMIRMLSEADTKAQVIYALHALKTAAIESPPDFIREYGMDKMDMEDEGNEYDDDDILTKRLQLIAAAADHDYFIPVRQLNEIAYLLAPQEHRTIMTSGNSAGRRFHPCDEHGPLPGCMFQGVNLQHEKNDNNQCLVCNIQEEWNNYVCYNATSRDFRETQRRFDEFVDEGGLMPRPTPARQEAELENEDTSDVEDIPSIPESINHSQEQESITEHELDVPPSKNDSHSSADLASESGQSDHDKAHAHHQEATSDDLNNDIQGFNDAAINPTQSMVHHNNNNAPDFYPLDMHDFPPQSHSLLNHYFCAPENVAKLAERICNTYCPFSIRGTLCPLIKCTKPPLCEKPFGTCGCPVGGHEIGPPCSSLVDDTQCGRSGCERNHNKAVWALAFIVGEMHAAGLEEEVWDGRVVFDVVDKGWLEYGREWEEGEEDRHSDTEEDEEIDEDAHGRVEDADIEDLEKGGGHDNDGHDDDAWSTATQISFASLYS